MAFGSPVAERWAKLRSHVHADHPGHVHLGVEHMQLELTPEADEHDPGRENDPSTAPSTRPPRSRPSLGRIRHAVAPELAPCSIVERAVILRVRAAIVADAWAVGLTSIAGVELLRTLTSRDPLLIASHNAFIASMSALLAVIVSPIVGSLSDAYGRVSFMAAGRSGRILFLLVSARMSSLAQRSAASIVFLGVLQSASVGTVTGAARSDLLGFQPQKASQLAAADGVYRDAGALSGLALQA